MKGAIAELKATDEQMAREIAKASDRATDKALEQALRPRVSMASPPQPQAVAMAARRPSPLVARSAQPRQVSVTPQVVTSYAPRPADARAMAPAPSAGAPPMDISAPRPPSPLREQAPPAAGSARSRNTGAGSIESSIAQISMIFAVGGSPAARASAKSRLREKSKSARRFALIWVAQAVRDFP